MAGYGTIKCLCILEMILGGCSKTKGSVAYISGIPEQFDKMPGFGVILWILPVNIQSYEMT